MDVYASADLPPVLAGFAILIATGVLALGLVVGLWRGWRRAVVARQAEDTMGNEKHPLVEGNDVVLFGIVRHLEGYDVAVKVSVEQAGTEAESSGSWSHTWTEIDRDIDVAPFLLELPNKEVVRIDPPRNVDVADALDQKVWIDRTKRVLSAELVPGEEIYARGRLEQSGVARPGAAYRDVAWGWALVPTDGQMLLSSEPLGAGLRQRASFHRGYAAIAALLLCVVQLSLWSFYARVAGETTIATVTGTRYYQTTDSDGDSQDHYVLELAIDASIDASIDESEVHVGESAYRALDRGSRVPVRRASYDNWNLGESPTLAIWHGLALVGIALVWAIMYAVRRRSTRPWFRRKVKETGPGRLPSPP